MGSGVYDEKISSGDELYADGFDSSIEQSAIYNQVFFECVGKELPAIILTPQCEIAHPGTELLVTVAGIFPASQLFERFLQENGVKLGQIIGKETTPRKLYEGIVKNFKKQYLANRVLEYHFLPKYKDKLENSFIDFSIVKTIHAKELRDMQKIAVLKSPWRESMPSRYAAYSLRIGVPDFRAELLEAVIGEISTLSVSS